MYRPFPNKLTKQKSTVVETSLPSFHKLIVTVIKSYSPQRTPNIITYRKYTNFNKEKFIDQIYFNLPKHNLQELSLEAFINMFKMKTRFAKKEISKS